jgi:maltooligosyltrehalose trehalohydrolase
MIPEATYGVETERCELGACYLGNGKCQFLVWAPCAGSPGVLLQCAGKDAVPMAAEARGYYRLLADDVAPGTRYRYVLSVDKTRPDPASRFQPEGVHGPSEVIDPSYSWTDDGWKNPPLAEYVFYELHPGTFSTAGTLEAIVPRLRYLRDLGVTVIELMPVAQFPGNRNWGYDGVFPFAVQNSYGGPLALKQLVNAAHGEGLAVALDVVYNHLGPEGNYLSDFGPYFTDRYKTPWGEALNFDGADSDEVRRFFIDNALQWITEFHVDALRLDAIHAIVDSSAGPFVQELTAAVRERCISLGREAYVIAESDRSDVRVIQPSECGGFGCHALWNDGFHHALHVLLTGERDGYYEDYGTIENLATAYTEGFVYSGQYSRFRRRRHGNSARGVPGERFVVCSQNHDQIGNRAKGDRLSALVDFESLKLAAGAVLFSPFLPLLFMGEEYGETAPFQYFTSHGDTALVEAVRRGRQEEFASFRWLGELPDPQDEETFLQSRLSPQECLSPSQRLLHKFYRELIRIRKHTPALSHLAMEQCRAAPLDEQTLLIERWYEGSAVLLLLNFSDRKTDLTVSHAAGQWAKVIHSADACWDGTSDTPVTLRASDGKFHITLSPRSFVLYARL